MFVIQEIALFNLKCVMIIKCLKFLQTGLKSVTFEVCNALRNAKITCLYSDIHFRGFSCQKNSFSNLAINSCFEKFKAYLLDQISKVFRYLKEYTMYHVFLF